MRGMRELGYIEGKNLAIEWRFADGKFERFPALAAELVQLKVEVLVTHTGATVQALKRATSTIPIVMTTSLDPVGSGFAASLARPGGNITGLALITADLSPKHVELLKLMLPSLSRVAILTNPGNPGHPGVLKNVQAAAQTRGLQVVHVQAGNAEEIERGFERMARERLNGAIVVSDSYFLYQRKQIAELGIKHRVATIYSNRPSVVAGILMSYGSNNADSYRRAATYVDKILKGAKPCDLPIEQPSTFQLTINRKTAKALGIAIPKGLLDRADEVID
ncbi:MAG: ABC transporter substrate-binding protein [Betaproteobacteria bacterium]|nr:ABC transporter substrate-binding protein [Betaproteobacteria bacterium]